MTWVIGRACPFGHAIGLSDIRVTYTKGNGKQVEVDCLQKIYNISPGLVLGFAGSVLIGLEIVGQLAEALKVGPDMRWDPIVVAESLQTGTKKLYNSFDPKIRAGGCELILLSAHPKENDGSAPWARCYFFRFRAPNFTPILAYSEEIVSIGSGEKIADYSKVLHSLEKNFDVYKLETHMRGGSALGLLMSVTSAIKKMPVKGISTHLHVCIVGRSGTKLGNNDITMQNRPEDNFIMPPVAQSWEEFQEILRSAEISKSVIERAQC